MESFGLAAQQLDSFLGYRYFDTFGGELLFPFGYGLGYGKAEFSSVSVGLDGCDVTVSATVENTGETYPVQEVVQVYCSRPDSGKTGPAWFLDTFQKTQVLAPGEQQTLHLRFPVTELAIFREKASAYVLEEGYYDIRVGSSSRATCLAGSIRLTRSAVVQAVTPCAFPDAELPARKEPVHLYTYPGEAEELETARRRAIRLSDRNLPRRSRKRVARSPAAAETTRATRSMRSNPAHAARLPSSPAWTIPASESSCVISASARPTFPALWALRQSFRAMGSRPMTIASGVCGLALKKDLEQDDGTVRHQYTTGFPRPACSPARLTPTLFSRSARQSAERCENTAWRSALPLAAPCSARRLTRCRRSRGRKTRC